MQLSTTGSWEQHNERVELQGSGSTVVVDNVDTCISRPPSQPELVWRPNYTIPTAENSSATTCGFLRELQAFTAAITDGAGNPVGLPQRRGHARGRRAAVAEHLAMRLTCSSLSLFSVAPEEAIATIAELGFPAIDLVGIPTLEPSHVDDARRDPTSSMLWRAP